VFIGSYRITTVSYESVPSIFEQVQVAACPVSYLTSKGDALQAVIVLDPGGLPPR